MKWTCFRNRLHFLRFNFNWLLVCAGKLVQNPSDDFSNDFLRTIMSSNYTRHVFQTRLLRTFFINHSKLAGAWDNLNDITVNCHKFCSSMTTWPSGAQQSELLVPPFVYVLIQECLRLWLLEPTHLTPAKNYFIVSHFDLTVFQVQFETKLGHNVYSENYIFF